MADTSLGPCFQAPKTDPDTCRHEPGWKFSWCVDEPVVTKSGVKVQTVQIVVCMACDTLLNEGVIRRPR